MFFICLLLNVFVYLGLRPIVDHYFIEYNNLVLSVQDLSLRYEGSNLCLV